MGITWVSCVYVHIYKHAKNEGRSGGMLLQALKIRCSEIASQTIVGQKQSHNSYMAYRILLPLFGCTYTHAFAKPARCL